MRLSRTSSTAAPVLISAQVTPAPLPDSAFGAELSQSSYVEHLTEFVSESAGDRDLMGSVAGWLMPIRRASTRPPTCWLSSPVDVSEHRA